MEVTTVTTADMGLLNAVRRTVESAYDAYLCVAFAHARGVRLIARELEGARSRGARVRLLATTVFDRDGECRRALSDALALGVDVRIHNRSTGTFHPKLYLSERPAETRAVIASANLTGGLLANHEIGVELRAPSRDGAIAEAWEWAEALWVDAQSRAWVPAAADEPADAIAPELLAALRKLQGETIETLADGRPNRIVEVDQSGVLVETEGSRRKRSGPQRVEPWMLNDAWEHLRERGELTNRELLDGLRVMRSSAVCAMLARVPGVQVASRRPIVLRLAGRGVE
jgi:HKD family nuclease